MHESQWEQEWEPKIALKEPRTFFSEGPRTCDTPNLQRTDASSGAIGPINSPNELHLLVGE